MTIKELSRYLLDEDLAEQYLLKQHILKTFTECPKCKSTHLGRIRRQRNKCYECKHEWNIRKDSFLESSHMNLSTFIGCLKFFSDEFSATKCADELEVSRITVNDLFIQLRSKMFMQTQEIPNQTNEVNLQIISSIEGIKISFDPMAEKVNSSMTMIRSKGIDGSYRYLLKYKNFRVKNILNSILLDPSV